MSVAGMQVVKSGYILTITGNNITIDFNQGAGITVEVGAQLIISGSGGGVVNLTSTYYDWLGIIVNGNSSVDQTTSYPTQQGYCGISSAVISYACIGVLVHGGGILKVNDSQFDNYYTNAVKMEAYLEPGYGDNISHFWRCNFINNGASVSVLLDQVARINFTACYFTDLGTSYNHYGIYSEGSTFNFVPDNSSGINGNGCMEWTGTRNYFENFLYAIFHENGLIACSSVETDIINVDFVNNQYGIYFNGATTTDHLIYIKGCTFTNNLGVSGQFNPEIDIHIKDCSIDFYIDNNTFDIESAHAKMVSIESSSTVQHTHVIRKNSFSNKTFNTNTAATYGIYYKNSVSSTLLQIECNDFGYYPPGVITQQPNNFDIYFDDASESVLNNDNYDANNSFIQPPSTLSDKNIYSTSTLTYHNVNSAPYIVSNSSSNVTPNVVSNNGSHCSIECDPNIGQLGKTVIKLPTNNFFLSEYPLKISDINSLGSNGFKIQVFDLSNNLIYSKVNDKADFTLLPEMFDQGYFYIYTIKNSNDEIIKRGKLMKQ